MENYNDDGRQAERLFEKSSFKYTNEDLETLFSEIGPLRQAFVVRDTSTKRSKGFGYVSFAIEEDTTSRIER